PSSDLRCHRPEGDTFERRPVAPQDPIGAVKIPSRARVMAETIVACFTFPGPLQSSRGRCMAVAGWVLGLVSIACLGGGLVHLARVVVVRSRIPGELCHAAMAVGMAAMFSPLGDPLPRPVWTVVFALGLVWFEIGRASCRWSGGVTGGEEP